MKIKAYFLAIICTVFFSSYAFGRDATVTGGVARGDNESWAFNLGIQQTYDSWLSGALGDLSPTSEISGHVWTRSEFDSVWGATIAPGLRYTMFTNGAFNPFIAGSVGGSIISDDHFGPRDLGSNLLFRTKGVVGVEFGEQSSHRIQGEYTHYSNWGLSNADAGYETYGASYSFAF